MTKTTIRSTFAALKKKQKSADFEHYTSTLWVARKRRLRRAFCIGLLSSEGSCDVNMQKNIGCFKVKTKKLRLNRKCDCILAEVLLAFRHYIGYTLHRVQGKDDDYGLY